MTAAAAAAEFRGRPVMIKRGLGLLGSNLAREFVAAGASVILVDSLLPEHDGNPANQRPWAFGDAGSGVTDPAEVAAAARSFRQYGKRVRLVHYWRGVSEHPAYACLAQRRLAESERLAAEVLGLPLYPERQNAEVAAVLDPLKESAK